MISLGRAPLGDNLFKRKPITVLRKLLAHPYTRGLSIDDPETTYQRYKIIRGNQFLWRIYDEWYRLLCSRIPRLSGKVLEIGSGGGFLRDYLQDVITSEILPHSGVQVVFDAQFLPFSSRALKAIVMVDVLHHIAESRAFFHEAERCLRSGGKLLMIEPWVSTWSRIVYGAFHHEPFDPGTENWGFPANGPLSGANGALPWIIFERDRNKFANEFPAFEIHEIYRFMPFRYLVSGGVSMRQLMPVVSFRWWKLLDEWAGEWPHRTAMFALIHLERR